MVESRGATDRHRSRTGRRLFLWLAGIASALVVVSGVLYVIVVLSDSDESPWHAVRPMFEVSHELNIPTWYSSMLWLMLSLAAIVVAVHAPHRRPSWIVLALVAALASLDEYAMLHERLFRVGSLLTPYLPADIFSYRWVIPGVLIAVVVVLLLLPMVLSLPRHIMVGFITAGAAFLLGAIVLETAGGFVESHFGQVTWHLMLLIHIEEWLEMVAVALAVAVTTEMIRVRRTPAGFETAYAGDRRHPPGRRGAPGSG